MEAASHLLISDVGLLEHLQGTLQMNFAFGVVCKVPNSFAKSKNSPTPRDFAFRFGKPKVWTPPPIFFFTDRARAFFSLRAILTYVVRASRRPGQVAAQPRPRSSFVAVVVRVSSAPSTSVLLRGKVPTREGPPPFPRRGRVRRHSWTRVSLRGRAAASSVRRREDTGTAQMASRLPENSLVARRIAKVGRAGTRGSWRAGARGREGGRA